jgi:ribonucleotide reductase beta subunit family protein with ferritin-like domain
MLLNLQRFGKMKGMSTIVEWSIRDETVHVEGNSRLFREFCNEHPKVVNDEFKAKIYQMARDVVMLEDNFIDLAFAEYDIEGITKEDVKQYIRYITDRRLLQLGLKTNFKVKENPLTWLDWILNGVSHDNFFEKRVTEYSINGMEGDWDWGKLAGS